VTNDNVNKKNHTAQEKMGQKFPLQQLSNESNFPQSPKAQSHLLIQPQEKRKIL
jgi:hypothetical protein